MIEYGDLIGLPYALDANGPEAYCCGGIAAEVYRRLGWRSWIPLRQEIADWYVMVVMSGPEPREWIKLEGAVKDRRVVQRLELGDLVLADGQDGTHVSVIVDEGTQTALTAAKSVGVFASPASRLSRARAVYRLSEDYR